MISCLVRRRIIQNQVVGEIEGGRKRSALWAHNASCSEISHFQARQFIRYLCWSLAESKRVRQGIRSWSKGSATPISMDWRATRQ